MQAPFGCLFLTQTKIQLIHSLFCLIFFLSVMNHDCTFFSNQSIERTHSEHQLAKSAFHFLLYTFYLLSNLTELCTNETRATRWTGTESIVATYTAATLSYLLISLSDRRAPSSSRSVGQSVRPRPVLQFNAITLSTTSQLYAGSDSTASTRVV